jgi:tRNA nucleotidyltransferase (CCA-adding enzyme)
LLAVEFTAPDVVEDVLFPQLYKVRDSIHEMFERYDFHVYNKSVWAGNSAVILFELESSKLPHVKMHAGPQVWLK